MNLPNLLDNPTVTSAIRAALDEDIGAGDATTLALVDPTRRAHGEIIARHACRVAGTDVAIATMRALDEGVRCETLVADGRDAVAGQPILRFRGPAAIILTAERTALNFMQRMCGIATLTSQFVDAVAEYDAVILDTRKTTPNLRVLEKYSVLCGGGRNHRFGLFDRVLIKDNHRRLWAGNDPRRLDLAVLEARKRFPQLEIEIEVETLEELHATLPARPEWVLLDNMSCDRMRECVALCRGKCRTEASGGIDLSRAREVAATGVDAISLGCLTHSAPAADLSLEWEDASA